MEFIFLFGIIFIVCGMFSGTPSRMSGRQIDRKTVYFRNSIHKK